MPIFRNPRIFYQADVDAGEGTAPVVEDGARPADLPVETEVPGELSATPPQPEPEPTIAKGEPGRKASPSRTTMRMGMMQLLRFPIVVSPVRSREPSPIRTWARNGFRRGE